MSQQPHVIGLIPARGGSKRVPGKNIRKLGEHPLIAYTIAAAIESGIFATILVSTDDEKTAHIAQHYGAEVPFLRPIEYAGDTSPDIEWIDYTLRRLQDEGQTFDCFSILRPTSPFRQPETIQRAWEQFLQVGSIDSLRAVEKCKHHPGKMWIVNGDRMTPLLLNPRGTPWHSMQYQALPEVYVQNASLEIAWTRVVFEQQTIAGKSITPFLTKGTEGVDVNDVYDWKYAEELLQSGQARLPTVAQPPYSA